MRFATWCGMSALCLALTVQGSPLGAQDAPPTTKPFCFRGRPLPACKTFMLTELTGLLNVAGTRTIRVFQFGDSVSRYEIRPNRYGLSLEVGFMKNRSDHSALGVSVGFGPADRAARGAAKVRYRRWLQNNGQPTGSAIDFGAGIAVGALGGISSADAAGITADVGVNFKDLVALTIRQDVIRSSENTAATTYVGARLGSQPALVGAGVLAVLATLLIVALSGSGT